MLVTDQDTAKAARIEHLGVIAESAVVADSLL